MRQNRELRDVRTLESHSVQQSSSRLRFAGVTSAAFHRRLVSRQTPDVLAAFDAIHTGRLHVTAPDGEWIFQGANEGPCAHVHLRDCETAAEVLSLRRGSIPDYLDDGWDSRDLSSLLTLVELNPAVFAGDPERSWLHAIRSLMAPRSAANVHARYRLSNDFYRAWLDSSLTYSCGLFDGQAQRNLEQAQAAKFEQILQALQPRPGASLLDIGCGWGAFGRYAAAHYGCRVHAITISPRQVQWARERVKLARLERLVSVALCDFRDVRGRYDLVVSVEAYEALGRSRWPQYFRTIARCLTAGGKAFVQAAVLSDAACRDGRGDRGFLRRNIYGNAELASWAVLETHVRRAGMAARSVVTSRDDYVRTLQCWQERLGNVAPRLKELGLDRRFQRLWRFYLAYCEAGYRAGVTHLVQAQLQHADRRAGR